MNCGPLSISDGEIKENLIYNGVTMVTVKIKYIKTAGGRPRGTMRINQFYKHAAQAYLRYAKQTLLPMAVDDWKYKTENGYPFNPFDAVMTYQVTFNDSVCLSLYWEVYEYTGGAHGNTTRYGDTWHTCTGWPVALKSLFPKGTRYRKILTDHAIAVAAQQIQEGTGYYFDDYPKLIRKYFRNENYYITPEGIAIFYGLYTIAPYSSGIPVFIYDQADILLGNC